MSTFLMVFGVLAALGVSSENPSHYNYSSVALALGCFVVAAAIDISKRVM